MADTVPFLFAHVILTIFAVIFSYSLVLLGIEFITPSLPPSPGVLIDDIVADLQTGDLILPAGTDSESTFIRGVGKCPVSHVTLVFRDSHKNPGGKWYRRDEPGDNLYLLEANVSMKFDFLTNTKGREGPSVVDLRNKLKDYPASHIVLRKYQGPVWDVVKLKEEMHALKKTTFNRSLASWFFGMYDGPLGDIGAADGKQFCSEFVAYIMQRMGVMDTEIPPHEYVPCDFYHQLPHYTPGVRVRLRRP